MVELGERHVRQDQLRFVRQHETQRLVRNQLLRGGVHGDDDPLFVVVDAFEPPCEGGKERPYFGVNHRFDDLVPAARKHPV